MNKRCYDNTLCVDSPGMGYHHGNLMMPGIAASGIMVSVLGPGETGPHLLVTMTTKDSHPSVTKETQKVEIKRVFIEEQ